MERPFEMGVCLFIFLMTLDEGQTQNMYILNLLFLMQISKNLESVRLCCPMSSSTIQEFGFSISSLFSHCLLGINQLQLGAQLHCLFLQNLVSPVTFIEIQSVLMLWTFSIELCEIALVTFAYQYTTGLQVSLKPSQRG